MATLRLFVLMVAVFAIAQWTDWPVLDRLAIAAGIVLLLAYLWSRWSLRNVVVTRQVASDRAQVGQTLTERITVANRGRLAKLWIEVRDFSSLPSHRASRVLHVRGRAATEWAVETICARRGQYHLGPIRLRAGDPFGLFPATQAVPATIDVVVYPPVIEVTNFVLPDGQLTGGVTSNRHTPFRTSSVAGIREYAAGDPYNRISWSATARTGHLMVKEFDDDPSADVWVVLDLDAQHHVRAMRPLPADAAARLAFEAWLDSTTEYGVTIAASIAHRALEQGRNVGLITTGAHYDVLPAERSDRQYLKTLETLAVVQADGRRPLGEILIGEARRFSRQSTLVVVTASTDEEWVRALVEIAARRVRVVTILVEAETFGVAPSSLMTVSALAASGIPCYLVKYGEGIATALATEGRAPVAASPERYG